MRVIIVGGAGDMGRVACAATAADPEITSVVVADRNGERAAEAARQLGPKATSTVLDIADADALAAALAGADLVLNTSGPFYLYGRPVLEAAVAAGKHYADIADDWEPTVEMLDLDGPARAAGITAIVGIGASPGVSNLMAAVAHAQLDTVDSLHTVWGGGSDLLTPDNPAAAAPPAVIDHLIHNLSDPIRIWRDGQYQSADALEQLKIVYPGIGPGDVWTFGHPEPIALPRSFPDIKHSLNLIFFPPAEIDAQRRVRDRVRAGELTVPEASREYLMMPGRREPGPVPAFPHLFAYAEGANDGTPTRVAVRCNVLPAGGMAEATSIPLAIAAGMIARGELTRRGAMGPEAAIDPDIFFPRLAPFAGPRASQPPLDIAIEPA